MSKSNGASCSLIQSDLLTLTAEEKLFVNGLSPEQWNEANQRKFRFRQNEIEAFRTGTVAELYNQKVDDYHGCGVELYHIGHRSFAEVVAAHVSDKQSRIIDVAAGSGFGGLQLRKCGFLNVDGLEPLQSLVSLLPSNVYDNMYVEPIHTDKPNSVENDTYDCAVVSGSVYPHQLTMEHFPQLARIVKPGGLIIFNLADFWYKYEQFGEKMDAMFQAGLEDGTFKSVQKERAVYYYREEDATVYIIKIC